MNKMVQEKTSFSNPLPILFTVVCAGIIIAYTVFVYTNNQHKKTLTSFLESAFSTTVSIENFEYSPISKSLHIKNLTLYHKNSENLALTIQDIRATIPNMELEPLEVQNMTVSGTKLYTQYHDGQDLTMLFQAPAFNLQNETSAHYQMIIRNIHIASPVLFAPSIQETDTVSFPVPDISVGDIGTGDYTIVLATISEAMAKNIRRITLKHNLLYQLRDGTARLGLIKKTAISQAQIQIERLDQELENANKTLQQQIKNIGKTLGNSMDSLRQNVKEHLPDE